MTYLRYSGRLRLLSALLAVLIPFAFGRAVPQDDVEVLPLTDNASPVNGEGVESASGSTTISTGVPEASSTPELAPVPNRPIFDNSTRFQDKKNYTLEDAPVVTSTKDSSNLTTYRIQDEAVFGGLPVLNIPVFFPAASNLNGSNPITASNATSNAIDFAMPRLLEQLQVSSEQITPLVQETSPLLTEALMYLLGQSDIPPEQNGNLTVSVRTLSPRGWSCCKGISIKKIGKAISDVGKAIAKPVVDLVEISACATFTQISLAGYLATFAQVKGQNPGPGISVTESHMYFLYQLYGYFPLTADLRLHFNTRKFLGFIGAYDAITFARDIFIVDDYSLSPKPGPTDFAFQSTVSTIIHEIRHSEQYRSLGWNIPAFGAKYLYQYCDAGFSYKKLKFEDEAFRQGDAMNALLFNKRGYSFFRYWTKRKLSPLLGYPVATNYRRPPGVTEGGRFELPFQQGILNATFYATRACWSYETTAEAVAREKAVNCPNFSGRCEPYTTIYEKTLARKRECWDESL